MKPCCVYLEWDSQFFGRRIGRVTENRLTPASVAEILQWCARERIDCLYFLCDGCDMESIGSAQCNRFNLVDVRMTFETAIKPGSVPAGHAEGIRPAVPGDVEKLAAIAKRSHTDSRFYHDGHFSRELCDALYATWITKSCQGRSERVLVAEEEDEPVGYITCDRAENGHGQIGLVAVAEQASGRGWGTRLVSGALDWFSSRKVERVEVVTQGCNVAAQRLYQRAGFITKNVELWFHWWSVSAHA
jgi:dTDP-4-amino-4,6-dideoxy-D-galactose acyltransferase